jgi:hypothetical protein
MDGMQDNLSLQQEKEKVSDRNRNTSIVTMPSLFSAASTYDVGTITITGSNCDGGDGGGVIMPGSFSSSSQSQSDNDEFDDFFDCEEGKERVSEGEGEGEDNNSSSSSSLLSEDYRDMIYRSR